MSDKSMKKLPSGLQYEDIKLADGPIVENGQRIRINYRIAFSMEDLLAKKLEDEYEDDLVEKEPVIITVGEGEVIRGVDEGVVGMRIGATRRLVVPPELAFGIRGIPTRVPSNATLFVEVTISTKTMSL